MNNFESILLDLGVYSVVVGSLGGGTNNKVTFHDCCIGRQQDRSPGVRERQIYMKGEVGQQQRGKELGHAPAAVSQMHTLTL